MTTVAGSVGKKCVGNAFQVLTICVWLAIGVCGAADMDAADSAFERLAGQWKVQSVEDAADIVGLAQEQLDALPGKFLSITKKAATFEQRTCASPRVSIRQRDTIEVFREYRIQKPKSLGKTVEYVDLKCDRVSVVGPFLFSEDGSLLFVWYGVLLRAAKVGTKVE